MRARILKSFDGATKEYYAAFDRNIPFGWLSKVRHSFKKTERIAALEEALKKSAGAQMPDEEALKVVLQHLLAPEATTHNHSFDSYFIKKLQIFVLDYPVKWDDKAALQALLDKINHIIAENPATVTKKSAPVEIDDYEGTQIAKPAM